MIWRIAWFVLDKACCVKDSLKDAKQRQTNTKTVNQSVRNLLNQLNLWPVSVNSVMTVKFPDFVARGPLVPPSFQEPMLAPELVLRDPAPSNKTSIKMHKASLGTAAAARMTCLVSGAMCH